MTKIVNRRVMIVYYILIMCEALCLFFMGIVSFNSSGVGAVIIPTLQVMTNKASKRQSS